MKYFPPSMHHPCIPSQNTFMKDERLKDERFAQRASMSSAVGMNHQVFRPR